MITTENRTKVPEQQRLDSIDERLQMVRRIRNKIAQLEKVLQQATKFGMSGKITISTDTTIVKTKEEFHY